MPSEIELRRKYSVPIIAFFVLFFAWTAIGSETYTLKSYYPSPYGSYSRFLTTGRTLLARDNDGVGIGTSTPKAKLHVASSSKGAFILQDGTEGLNKVLISDKNGVATWDNRLDIGLEIVTNTGDIGFPSSLTTSCPQGKKVLDCGCYLSHYYLNGVYPDSPTSCKCSNSSSLKASATGYAICARVQ